MTANTVLITGANGFIGHYLSMLYAAKGWDVIGIGQEEYPEKEWRKFGLKQWILSDVSIDSLKVIEDNIDLIVHCAGSASVPLSVSDPYLDYQSNVRTTLEVLEYVRTCSPYTKIVLPSSVAVHGEVKQLPIMETDPLKPISPYGVHKKIAEDLCLSYARNFSLSVSIVRLFSVYGPGLRRQILWDACNKANKHDDSAFYGTGNETRDFIHVEDAAELLYLTGEYAVPDGLIVNGGTGVSTAIGDLISEIYLTMNYEVKPDFSMKVKVGDPVHYQADISRARSLGWTPKRDIHQGIRDYVNWFRELNL